MLCLVVSRKHCAIVVNASLMRLERYTDYGYNAKSLGVKSIPFLFS